MPSQTKANLKSTAELPARDGLVPFEREENATELPDSKFTLTGTKIRFEVDVFLRLVSGVGDAMSLGLSGILVVAMAPHGASELLIARMMINLFVDATLGSIPNIGNLFDLFFKANQRNLRLMRAYFYERKHAGSVTPVVFEFFCLRRFWWDC